MSDDELPLPDRPANIHLFDVDEYERVAELGVMCHRLELLEGVIECRDTGRPYRFHPEDFAKLVEAGVIDPARVELVDGLLLDKAE